MIEHVVRTHRSEEMFARDDQLAWKIALLAADPVDVDDDVVDMIVNRVVDDTAVAAASLERGPVAAARDQALRHPASPGATVLGLDATARFSPEWAAWANAVAVRELDFHDTFLAEEYAHPGDNIAPLLAVAQHVGVARGITGRDVVRAIATAYEVQVDLCRAISLHRHRIDHVAHLGPSVAAGLGTLLGLDPEVTYHAVGQALHTTTATRQSRKGEISTWKAYAPAHAAKVAIEAVDRAMRGQTSPAPIYEGEDGVIAWMLDGPAARYTVALPGPGEPKRAVLSTFTKEHSAEYQAQAWIDVARRLYRDHPEIHDGRAVQSVVIRTSHHTHLVIGSGSHDPQKFDPDASRETLDHSLPYIFAVALQDGGWHHEASYAPARSHRPDTVSLWRKISTVEDPEWSRRYLATDQSDAAFGGRVVITLSDGTRIEEEIAFADAHPRGAHPFDRDQYDEKFRALSRDVIDEDEAERFLRAARFLPGMSASDFDQLTIRASPGALDRRVASTGLL